MTAEHREVLADWLIVIGGVVLLGSLFLTWSHQFSAPFLAQFGSSAQLRKIPRDPTAWQVYSAADVMLGLLAGWLIVVALIGSRAARIAALLGSIVALAFTTHALGRPPTNGANLSAPALSAPGYFPDSPDAGAGETVAMIALIAAIAGLGLSFTAD